MAFFEQIDGGGSQQRVARRIALGFVYWLFFLLVLEPDNILRASHAGGGLAWNQELLRIGGASLLGAGVTPLVLALVDRFPIEGATAWRNAGIQAAGAVLFAAALIAVSCMLAEWLLVSETRRLPVALGVEFVANGPLLVFVVAGLVAIGHTLRFFEQTQQPASPGPAGDHINRVAVKARGAVSFVELEAIEWIETQGNYVALHVGAATHLIRESLASFESKLDPKRFARIHRRIVVAIPCVDRIESLGGGDALLCLKNGTKLRLSRSFRERVASRFPQFFVYHL